MQIDISHYAAYHLVLVSEGREGMTDAGIDRHN